MLVSSWGVSRNPFFESTYPGSSFSTHTQSSQRYIPTASTSADSSSAAGPSSMVPKSDSPLYFKPTRLAAFASDQASTFLRALMAPYIPPPPAPAAPELPIDIAEVEQCRSVVDWSRISEESASSDEDEVTPVIPSACSDNMERAIYKPHGPWAWADGLAIVDSNFLTHLSSGRMCSAVIKNGNLGGRHITFISKSWATQEQGIWRGFHSELALYKSEQHLRPLQGIVVPSVIGVHVLPGEINFAMEPPHHSFWIEASADMPDVLKERCIEAFEKIHSVGVLHGDVELRHMLIGGDGKVTLIDFQASRALVPNPAVMLQKAEPNDLVMEMRKVKYKLNYGKSREKELQKVVRCEERSSRNRVRRYKHKRRSRGERPGYISDYEDDPAEDKAEPPVHTQDWNEHWVIASDAIPRRFVMPGQTSEDLQREVQCLLSIIDRMEAKKTASAIVLESRLPSTPPPTPTITSEFQEQGQVSLQPATTSAHNYCLRKRKQIDPVLTSRPTKRLRSSKLSSATPSSASMSSVSVESSSSSLVTSGAVGTTSSDSSLSFTLHQDEASVPESKLGSLSSATLTTSPSNPRFPPIKVRDFAYEPYNGYRGYYVPHPPTEARAAKERQWHIARLNAQRCLESNLPHPAALVHVYGESQIVRLEKGKKPMVQMGSLKRAREDLEDPNAARAWSVQKKAKYELAKRAMNGEVLTGHGQGDVLDWHATCDELPNLPEGPRILTNAEYVTRHASTSPTSPSTNARSILRKTSPVPLVSQQREDWVGSQLEKSPKIGPEDLYVGTAGNTVMLGVHYDSNLGSFGDHVSGASHPSCLHGSSYRTGDMMALATLGIKLPISKSHKPKLTSRVPTSSHISLSLTSDGLARPEPRPGLPVPRKKTQYTASRGQSSSSTHGPFFQFRNYPLPSSRHASSRHASPISSDDEREVENLLRPLGADDVTPSPDSRSWMRFLLRFLRG